uniref:Uncharacterized protein n=1 Tax=Anguilla anguilla TaxID=7936 RepID=A0A0E9SFE7_ANGAN
MCFCYLSCKLVLEPGNAPLLGYNVAKDILLTLIGLPLAQD